jgi:hypothetical protein
VLGACTPKGGDCAVPSYLEITGARTSTTIGPIGYAEHWHASWGTSAAGEPSHFFAFNSGTGWSTLGDLRDYSANVGRWIGDPQHPAQIKGFIDLGYPARLLPAPWRGYGVLSTSDAYYHFVSYLDSTLQPIRPTALLLEHAEGKGEAWTDHRGQPTTFGAALTPTVATYIERADGAFSAVSVLQMGSDFSANRDGYVYLYALDGSTPDRARRIVLARVPLSRILDPTAVEAYAGDDPTHPIWSAALEDRRSVIALPDAMPVETLEHSIPSAVWAEPLQSYLLVAAGISHQGAPIFASASTLWLYSAPNPWGPWTLRVEIPQWILRSDPQSRPFSPVIAPGWIAPDGSALWILATSGVGWPNNNATPLLSAQALVLTTMRVRR